MPCLLLEILIKHPGTLCHYDVSLKETLFKTYGRLGAFLLGQRQGTVNSEAWFFTLFLSMFFSDLLDGGGSTVFFQHLFLQSLWLRACVQVFRTIIQLLRCLKLYRLVQIPVLEDCCSMLGELQHLLFVLFAIVNFAMLLTAVRH